MVVKDDLKDYRRQAIALIYSYGDVWMLKSDECIGDITHWLMHADNIYDPSKGAKPGTWRVVIARFRIKHLRRADYQRRKRFVCFTDVLDAERTNLIDLVYNRTSTPPPPNYADVATEILDVIISRSKLSERQRQVMGMRRDGLKMIEIAAKFKVSKQAVSLSYRLALKKCQMCAAGLVPTALL
jgi:RNA polymerase sigma factor (sigma-70 family)